MKMESNIKERLDTAIAGIKCVREYYEAEMSTYVHEASSSLPHPEGMIRGMSSALEPLHRALGGVVKEESREKDS